MAGKWKFGPRADRLCLKWGQSCSIVKRRAHTGIASVSPPAAVATGRSEGDITVHFPLPSARTPKIQGALFVVDSGSRGGSLALGRDGRGELGGGRGGRRP